MKTLKFIITIGLSLFFMGCPARSLFPLFTEKDSMFNPGLVGAWVDQGNKETYYFQKGGGKDYAVIVCREKEDTSHYTAQLGQLGKKWFLDSYPSEDPKDFQLVPTRIISKIWLNGDTLTFASLESNYLKGLIESKKIKIPYTTQKGDVILIASTDELQQLILQLSQDDKAFGNPTTLVRLK